MDEPIDQAESETLRRELREAREQLSRMAEELRGVDAELEEIELERRQFGALREACEALETLEELGGGALFWEGLDARSAPGEHIHVLRTRSEEFEKALGRIEERRVALLLAMEARQLDADSIAGEVLEAERIAEQKRLEWLIERDVETIPIRTSVMPWSRGGEDDRELRKALAISLLLSLLLGLLLPMIEIPMPERWELLEEQERLTQLIREERPTPLPTLPEPEVPIERTPSEPTEEPQLADSTSESPEAAPAAQKSPEPSRGILAFRSQFSSLAESATVDRLGSNAKLEGGDAAPTLPERSMVATQAPGSSGGINVAKLSRDTGGTADRIGGVAIERATSTIGGGGGGDRPLAGGGPGLSRTDEEIQIVFDRHKSALYRLYNRALRKNPTLKGQIVLRLTIEPDGSVSACAVKSSDMKAPSLAERVVQRVQTFDFGAKDGIPAITIVYPIDFLPAT